MVLGELPATLRLIARHYAGFGARDGMLPDPEGARVRPEGLAGLGHDLSLGTLMQAYAKGLYPRSDFGPQKWWAPAERMVLFIENFRLGSRLAPKLRRGAYRVSFDAAFNEVVAACGRPRPRQGKRRWLRRDISAAFAAAFEAGVAHSVEVWDETGSLAGGAYGLAIGKVFFTEAEFSDRPDAGKIALATLNCHLQRWGYLANDAKRLSGSLCNQGFSLVPRAAFNRFLEKACAVPAPLGRWSVDTSLQVGIWEPGTHRLSGVA